MGKVDINDKVFQSEFWQSLKSYGRLPIEPAATGRSNPFSAAGAISHTPEDRDARRVSDVITLTAGLAKYYESEHSYPAGQSLALGLAAATCLTPAGWKDKLVCEKASKKYLDSIPFDPGSGQYIYTSDGESYTLKVFAETASGDKKFWEYSSPPIKSN